VTTQEVRVGRSGRVSTLRSVSAVVGIVLWVAFLAPPLLTWAKRYEFVQALQYCVFAFWVPVLITVGAPLRFVGPTVNTNSIESTSVVSTSPRRAMLTGLLLARSRVDSQRRLVAVGFVFVLLEIFWRMAGVVDLSVNNSWLLVVESLTLVPVGIAFMSDLVESPPLRPGTTRPFRIGASAIAMWVVWILAYLDGMSAHSWYSAFHHVAGRGISQAADQQFSAGSIWLISASVFVPIIFWNLTHWLQTEDDPDDELYLLVRQERKQGFFGSRRP